MDYKFTIEVKKVFLVLRNQEQLIDGNLKQLYRKMYTKMVNITSLNRYEMGDMRFETMQVS